MLYKLAQSKYMLLAMTAFAVLAAAAGFFISVKQTQREEMQLVRVDVPGLFWPNPRTLTQFEVQDNKGNVFDSGQLLNKWSLIFFGYTHCPDICPVTMSLLGQIYPKLKKASDNIQVLFVTVDPERDTIDKLNDYIAYFNDDFIGLGGNQKQIDQLTRLVGVAWFHQKKEGDSNYLVDHSASLFLIDPDKRLVGKISPPHTAEMIKSHIMEIQTFINEQG